MLISVIKGKKESIIKKESKLFKVLLGMCSDTNWKLRALAAKEMKFLIPLFENDKDASKSLHYQLKELLGDEDSFVKVEAI